MKATQAIQLGLVQYATSKPFALHHEARSNVDRLAEEAVPLAKDLMSLSIEFGNAVDFFGDTQKPNLFSKQLLQNVIDRSGTPAILRIGGNTQDRANFCETCTDTMATVVLNDPNDPKGTEAKNVTFNANLFRVLTENVPAGSPLIFGLNYRNDSLELAEGEIRAAFGNLDQSLVMAYELGNEVNLYGNYRPSDYDVNVYARDMQEWIPALAASGAEHDPKFQFPYFAGPQLFRPDMTIANLVKMGVPQSLPQIECLAIHGYPWDICSPQSAALVDIRKLLNHSETTGLLDKYSGEIKASKSLDKELHMGETGSVACHGKDGVSNTLGAALWELDYALSGSVAGINRFFFHMGKGDFYYSMWEPLPSPKSPIAHINPTYYTMLFVADLVADLEEPRIAAVKEEDSAVHFAIYDGDKLEKLVLLNLGYFNETSGSERGIQKVDVGSLMGPGLGVRRLTGHHSDATTGVTWAGQSTDDSGKIVGEAQVENACGGYVTLFDSEAVIVERV
ncbi:glycoside hydrolase superfamily [Plectosphaerella plurivora]|uniref:Glycoside hydrolase superfamily n=1 Tax=Plectosphaerella plurivora TaxID=936078 RepID=A0A9P8VIB9_9PEZI|nr:glycoside hydrolase superfamily [Plectosphaerella plurivora]